MITEDTHIRGVLWNLYTLGRPQLWPFAFSRAVPLVALINGGNLLEPSPIRPGSNLPGQPSVINVATQTRRSPLSADSAASLSPRI